ncbi:MAG: ARMT1-like domain-containing protein [Lachnospiraceae bacterium]|nr:ARMT1-like domain-containing protein [Lachnospiraceae bacterium]
MRLSDSCAECMYRRQKEKNDNKEYLAEVKELLDHREEVASSPELVLEFNLLQKKYFGNTPSYKEINKKYNDLVLSMEDGLREKIQTSKDPLATAIVMSRIGNYIDFGAMNTVEEDTFIDLFKETAMREDELKTYESFCKHCSEGKKFLLFTDNCGEVVLDKLMLEELEKKFPHLEITVMVRGGEVLNDATLSDAEYIGMTKKYKVITSGVKMPGTVYRRVSSEAKKAIDEADVILSKGQGNYEGFAGEGIPAFYAFLCKCDLFVNRFEVPRLTGMFVEE